MQYARLTKEQLEELHQEFINFLATQSITADEWQEIKTNKPHVAEEEIDVFSDLVWENVLTKANYLEHISPNQMHLFNLREDKMTLIAVKINKEGIDITSKEGYQWLQQNLGDDNVVFMSASKEYSEKPNADKFKLIQQGAVITKGDLYNWFSSFVLLIRYSYVIFGSTVSSNLIALKYNFVLSKVQFEFVLCSPPKDSVITESS